MRYGWLGLCAIAVGMGAGCAMELPMGQSATPAAGGADSRMLPAKAYPQRMPAALAYPAVVQGDYVLKEFKFRSGQTLPAGTDLHMHVRTIGTAKKDAAGKVTNAVLIMHGTTGTGGQFTVAGFGGQLFGAGQPLDAAKYFIIMPDDIGHGRSSQPSEGLHAKFPNYGYLDMVEAEYRLVRESLGVNHLRLVMGTSMGGMHTWLWGQEHPDFMDALLPLASAPVQIAGRKMIIDDIRQDPEWKGGEYTTQPRGLGQAMAMMWLVADNPAGRYQAASTLAAADAALERYVAQQVRTADANDVLYAFEASRDYDPAPGLGKITAPLVAINSADDLINPDDLDVLQKGVAQVKNGHGVMLAETPQTRGHGTHTMAWIWKGYLEDLMKETERK